MNKFIVWIAVIFAGLVDILLLYQIFPINLGVIAPIADNIISIGNHWIIILGIIIPSGTAVSLYFIPFFKGKRI